MGQVSTICVLDASACFELGLRGLRRGLPFGIAWFDGRDRVPQAVGPGF